LALVVVGTDVAEHSLDVAHPDHNRTTGGIEWIDGRFPWCRAGANAAGQQPTLPGSSKRCRAAASAALSVVGEWMAAGRRSGHGSPHDGSTRAVLFD
jgi:hypothetical protein